jgi:hypothetical protein
VKGQKVKEGERLGGVKVWTLWAFGLIAESRTVPGSDSFHSLESFCLHSLSNDT